MRLLLAFALALTSILVFADRAASETPRLFSGTPVQFSGAIKQRADVSAIEQAHSFLLIGSDETVGKNSSRKNIVQLLRRVAKNWYVYEAAIPLCDPIDIRGNCKKKNYRNYRKEMDIEGIAVEGRSVYVIGSHSAVRKKNKL